MVKEKILLMRNTSIIRLMKGNIIKLEAFWKSPIKKCKVLIRDQTIFSTWKMLLNYFQRIRKINHLLIKINL